MAGRRGGNASNVGMMEGAFFVSRGELIGWVNSLLQVGITKVEQCASGAIYCQILDACHPSTVAMRKVNWMAKTDHEFIPNYKILQAAFDKNGIERHVAVDNLIRAKYQDNLEFLQFMKCYWEREGAELDEYDPKAPREGKTLPAWAHCSGNNDAAPAKDSGGARTSANATRQREGPRPASQVGTSAAPKAGEKASTRSPRTAVTVQSGQRSSGAAGEQSPKVRVAGAGGAQGAAAGTADQKVVGELQERLVAQQDEMEELRADFDGLEVERDYYFRKLREVEILCTTLKSQMESGGPLEPDLTPDRLVTDIQTILYAEGDKGGEPDNAAAA